MSHCSGYKLDTFRPPKSGSMSFSIDPDPPFYAKPVIVPSNLGTKFPNYSKCLEQPFLFEKCVVSLSIVKVIPYSYSFTLFIYIFFHYWSTVKTTPKSRITLAPLQCFPEEVPLYPSVGTILCSTDRSLVRTVIDQY
jgi:hypothetical protein